MMMQQKHPRLAIENNSRNKALLDPLMSLQVAIDHHTNSDTPMGSASSRSSIASVCFLPTFSNTGDSPSARVPVNHDVSGADHGDPEEDSDSSSSSDGEELQFRTRNLLEAESRFRTDPTRSARHTAAATQLLSNRYLASCHANGECLLWDLGRRQLASSIDGGTLVENRGPGWMLRRLGDHSGENTPKNHFLYQTRDPRGTVSIHAWDHPSSISATGTASAKMITSFRTYSQTFCAAAPCVGNSHLLALPSANDSDATLRDVRVDPSARPMAVFDGAPVGSEDDTGYDPTNPRKHGMLTSLAFSQCGGVLPSGEEVVTSVGESQSVVACGMESGTVFFHDLRRLGKQPISFKLSDDPVLALDLAPSHVTTSSHTASTTSRGVVAIAGMAGEAVGQQELPSQDQGTVAILKATFPEELGSKQALLVPKVRLRSRLATCQPGGDGKPGVSLCRFQPGDGRLFAVAGWDQRVRIFDRAAQAHSSKKSKASPLAILKGHSDSVRTVDWAPDSAISGLCATGAPDGRIHIWRCFSQSPV